MGVWSLLRWGFVSANLNLDIRGGVDSLAVLDLEMVVVLANNLHLLLVGILLGVVQSRVPVTIGKVEDQTNGQPDDETDNGRDRVNGNETNAAESTEDREDRSERHLELAGTVGLLPAENQDRAVDQEEGKEGTDRGQISKQVDGEHASGSSADGTSDGSGVDGGLVLGVKSGGDLREKTIDSHGEEDTGLSDQQNQHDGDETSQDTNFADNGEPLHSSDINGDLEWSTLALSSNVLVVDNAQHGDTGGNVENSARDERQANTDGKITLRVAGFLSSRADGIETNESKEDDSGTTQNTGSTKLAEFARCVWWDERLEVIRVDPLAGTEDEEQDDNELDNDQDVVDTS